MPAQAGTEAGWCWVGEFKTWIPSRTRRYDGQLKVDAIRIPRFKVEEGTISSNRGDRNFSVRQSLPARAGLNFGERQANIAPW